MKKYFAFFALLLCGLLAVGVSAADGVVYVADGGTGDGTTAATPLGSLTDAYNALGSEGGRIVIVETYTLGGNFVEPEHAGVVTLTQEQDGVSYRTASGCGIVSANNRFILNGPTTFEKVTLRGSGVSGTNFILIVAQFNPVVFETGVECLDFGDFSIVAKGASIIGGTQLGADKYNTLTDDLDSHITIKSGEVVLVGFSRQVDKQYTGMAHIDISGGTVHNIYLGAANNGKGGDVNMTISGGSFVGDWYSTPSTGASNVTGSLTITVTGGDFSNFSSADGTVEGGTSKIDLSALSAEVAATITPKLSNFNEIVTESGTVTTKIPDEVFLSGTFTASDGTTIPYRYYLPEGYETSGKTYPVFLYMHGNGSRGSDNKTQLTTNGAALNTAVLNSGYECIMIAPQCPASPNAWIGDDAYPGSDAFAEDFADGSLGRVYLNAAMELLNSFITNDSYPIDTSRIYVTGSSNGGAATWAMTALHPHVFAAAVPLAGTGCSTSPVTEAGAAALASSYVDLPIWTFHGDADTTLSIEGTNGMVAAIQAAGGTNIKYTVISGGTHNIWSAAAATDGLVDWIFAQKNDNFVNTISGEVVPDTDPLDFNGDGKVDITDALDMLRALLNGNNKYTLKNVLEVLKAIVTEG